MVLVCSLLLAGLIVLAGRNWIRAHAGISYALAALVSLTVIVLIWSGATFPRWVDAFLPIFTQGGLAGALFIIVMFAAAVPDGSAFMRAVMPVRGELSILASILTLGHNIAFGRRYITRLIHREPLSAAILGACLCSAVMLMIMLPLFVTSFKCVRKRIQPSRWKRLQRWAYLFYALMYVHVMLLNSHSAQLGGMKARINMTVYSAVFIPYGCMRVGKALRKRGHSSRAISCGAALLLICVCCKVWSPELRLTPVNEAAAYTDGKYTGSGIGYNGRMTVSVTIEDGRIAGVRVTGHVEDEPYISDTIEGIIPAVLEAQSVDVQIVSGATSSSDGMLTAISKALEQAQSTDGTVY